MIREHYMKIADILTEALCEMDDGACISTVQLLKGKGYNINDLDETDLLEIHEAVLKLAVKKQIILDMSAHDGKFEGLPYNLDYMIKKQ